MPEAFRHNHPFLAAGTDSSPDGRARWNASFPTIVETSRPEHTADPDHCRHTPGIQQDSRQFPHGSAMRSQFSVTHTTRHSPRRRAVGTHDPPA
ncbi:conserved domain protein [Actinomyces sp. oral taxon 170 str. F0386]|nr:conserved domain protein [Actinomyces sp. oral taxon 170 str. F0386]